MKKLLLIGALALATLGVQAATYSFSSISSPVFIGANGSYSGTWDLNAAGYNSANESIISADAFFTVDDRRTQGSDGGSEQAVVTLDGIDFASSDNFIVSMLGGSVSFSIVADGIVNWVVKEASGTSGFLLSEATLDVVTAKRTQQPVPDGGSVMALLGMAVLGLGWANRRVRA